ncbi:hypothetical protein PBAL39_19245 [Pedobacter sp. BAL39]|uniref:LysM peptidoglycan-binding domain-containing protein n=1 Tax=Pedobacter sp. BAL39 TaxID=391596 RepID=UPI000155AC5A|nr:LysM peptidoglycan-binding domain-containing protein [Pedobacter sp. BAL39]EDM34458.1 hypothetical protein PBAL39_19245 [Pedobacter sp. BAL39]
MYKYYVVSLFAVLGSLTAHASSNTRDSIGVENYNGKKLIVHQVVAKDTYYSIGRRYSVLPKDIITFNDNKFLQIGVIIKVPTNIPFDKSAGSNSTTAGKNPVGNTTTTPAGGVTETTETTVTEDGITLVEHAVQRKENLNLLAERYGTTVNEIKRINNLRTINLQIGQLLKIPTKNPATETETPVEEKPKEQVVTAPKPTEQPKAPIVPIVDEKEKRKEKVVPAVKEQEEEFIEHTVASNETMYSIATKYKLTMEQLKAKNNLTDNSLRVGQHLLIKGTYPRPSERHLPTQDNDADTLSSIKDPSLRFPASRYGLNQIDEKGTAVWIDNQDLDPSKMLVLHRNAPIGTVMKITNPMTNRSTFAKVVGKFTENESTKDVIIVMTKAVADALGAIDKRFFCNLTYGGQDNDQ